MAVFAALQLVTLRVKLFVIVLTLLAFGKSASEHPGKTEMADSSVNNPLCALCSTSATKLTTRITEVVCPSGCLGEKGSVWGTDSYTEDSSICLAAIHAGLLSNDGGIVDVETAPGQCSYQGSTRNQISTKKYGPWVRSFNLRRHATKYPKVTASCSMSANLIHEQIAEVICPPGCLKETGSVWGSHTYTDDSSVCRSAIHSGQLTDKGGHVIMEKKSGLDSYEEFTKNGVTSNKYGKWSVSFILHSLPVSVTCSLAANHLSQPISAVICPPGCLSESGDVWGTDVYTDDSSVCRAAIHAGQLTNSGGEVTIEKTSGLDSYKESTRNGVESSKYGSWSTSFKFRVSPAPAARPECRKIDKAPTESSCLSTVSATCSLAAKTLTETVTQVICPAGCLDEKGDVWGTGIYTDDSSVCRAAIHAGILKKEGGKVTVEKIAGLESYEQSTNNGVTSMKYGSWTKSIVFHSPAVSATCAMAGKQLPKTFTEVMCPAGCLKEGGAVWGTDVYTDDSSICLAAIHSGHLTDAGGKVRVLKKPGLESYTESTKNEVKSSKYGSWPHSFIFYLSPTKSHCKTSEPEPTQPPYFSKESATCSMPAKELTETKTLVKCPAGCLNEKIKVWGTDVYTDDSSICQAAIHSGRLSNEGGDVIMQKKDGQESYKGSTNNEVTSTEYGEWPRSFVLIALPSPKKSSEPSSHIPTVSASCAMAGKELKEPITEVTCPAGCLNEKGDIWGSTTYTDDSSICRAAIHSGQLSNGGGKVTLQKMPGQEHYEESTKNEIKSLKYGPWSSSFKFCT